MSDKTQQLIFATQNTLHLSEAQLQEQFSKGHFCKDFVNSIKPQQQTLSWPQIKCLGRLIETYTGLGVDPKPYLTQLIERFPNLFGEGLETPELMEACLLAKTDQTGRLTYIEAFLVREFSHLASVNKATGALQFDSRAYEMGITDSNYGDKLLIALHNAIEGVPKSITANGVAAMFTGLVARLNPLPSPLDLLNQEYDAMKLAYPALAQQLPPVDFSHHKDATDPWKPVLALLEPLWKVYDVHRPQQARERENMLRWLVALIARTAKPGCVVQYCLVFSGKGGCGKSVWAELLAIPGAPPVQLDISDLNKNDFKIKKAQSSIVNIDEIDCVARKRDTAHLKSEITRTSTSFRIPYARQGKTVEAGWVYFASTNEEALNYDDGADNRRYLVCYISGAYAEGVERANYLVEFAPLIRAVAYKLFEGGYNFDVDAELVKENRETCANFTVQTLSTQLLEHYSDALKQVSMTDDGKVILLTTADMWNLAHGSSEKFHPRKADNFIAALERLGWTKHRVRKSRTSATLWFPPGVPSTTEVCPIHPDQLPKLKAALLAIDGKPFTVE